MLKLTISEFFKRLISNIWRRSHEITLITIRWFLLVTFIAVVIADLTECRPLQKAWQVVPDPGPECRQGYGQLLTMGVADVVTDFLLVFFPISIILSSTMRKKRKIQLAALFAGSLLPAGTTLFRLPHIIDRHGSQQFRSLLASVEILFATAIANALVLGSFVRDKGVKKQRWKFGSLSDSIERTNSRRPTIARHWGSDEDLVRGLGMGLDPELRETESFTPRPAPMATPALLNGRPNMSAKARKMMGNGVDKDNWQFPSKHSGSDSNTTDDDLDLLKLQPADYDRSPGDKSEFQSPRKVSFFDVGGLLDDEPRAIDKRVSSINTMESADSSVGGIVSQQGQTNNNNSTFWTENGGLSPPPPRRGSAVLLHDIGGLLGPTSGGNTNAAARTQSRSVQRGQDLKDFLKEGPPAPRKVSKSPSPKERGSAHSLLDVGGLLGTTSEGDTTTNETRPTRAPSQNNSRSQDLRDALKDRLPDTRNASKSSRPNRRGSGNSLQDIGGLLSPIPTPVPERKSSQLSHKPSRSRSRDDRAGFELKEILQQNPNNATRGPRSTSPMSKAKMRSAFDDIEPPRKASPTPQKDILAAQYRQRDFGVQPPEEQKIVPSKNPLERHFSLQDVGGLLKS